MRCRALPLAVFLAAASVGRTDPVAFAQAELAAACQQARAPQPAVRWVIDSGLGGQAYAFANDSGGGVIVKGGDAAGAMYGGLDLADAVKVGPGAVAALTGDPRVHRPYVPERGIKFNLPLDLRTPSYGDASNAAQANLPEMWKRDFWQALFDEMARDRYNVISLWNLHPFPSLVRVPEFPQVALDDVWRTREPLSPVPLPSNGTNAVSAKWLANHEVVERITMDGKIAFWRDVMQLAADRGISVYLFTWNVFTDGTGGKYGITDDLANPTTIAYFRASVRELIKTYPLLAGIGITAGENMEGKGAAAASGKEEWLWKTYGEGARDAVRELPNRTVRLIHRYHETTHEEIVAHWKDYPDFGRAFTLSYKYAVAHMYSEVKPPFIAEVQPKLTGGLKTWLEVRDDDIYSFRWGDPDFAREYVLNFPPPSQFVGFLMGPDGFLWARDFLDRNPAGARPLVMQKQWYSFLMWGTLAFDPTLSDSHFQDILHARLPGADATELFEAVRSASRVIPHTTRFFWHNVDLGWLPEACVHNSHGTKFYSVADFMRGKVMPGAAIANIREWRDHCLHRTPLDAAGPVQSPIDVADALAGDAADSLRRVGALRRAARAGDRGELRDTLADCESMAELGNYYAEKIRGACDLALYDATRSPADQTNAVAHLERALAAWRRYAAGRDARYLPGFYNRIGWVDLTELTAEAAKDIALAKSWRPGSLESD